jgi:3-methylfumaryl-CoA hydratase
MHLQDWVGRTESVSDVATPTPYAALSATLDGPALRPPAGTPLPHLWHWLYFLPLAPQAGIGADGHPLRGRLIFVTVRHVLRCHGSAGAAITERHHIVYRAAPQPGDVATPPQAAPAAGAWARSIQPDAVLLFRYSALTFNGHRIHYDRPYATTVEAYPGLVVHGPLIATLLLELLRREMPQARVRAFEFKAVRPTFDTHPFSVHGQPSADGSTVHLWAQDHAGWLTMDAIATLA